MAVGSVTPDACATHGPWQLGPDHTTQDPLTGVISATWPLVKPTPATVNGVAEVTMTRLPSFSVMSTRTDVFSCPAESVLSVVPP